MRMYQVPDNVLSNMYTLSYSIVSINTWDQYYHFCLLDQGTAKFFCEGPGGKYFGLCGLYDAEILTLLLWCKSSQRHVNKWAWPHSNSNKTSLTQTESRLHSAHGLYITNPCFRWYTNAWLDWLICSKSHNSQEAEQDFKLKCVWYRTPFPGWHAVHHLTTALVNGTPYFCVEDIKLLFLYSFCKSENGVRLH